jgi:predicted nucleic acid-binding protein
MELLRYAERIEAPPIVPTAVIAEWWRGRTDARERIRGFLRVVPLDEATARLAGEAIAGVSGSTVIDAVVMASAARHGADVFTGDVDDLSRLQRFFPGIRLFGF